MIRDKVFGFRHIPINDYNVCQKEKQQQEKTEKKTIIDIKIMS